MISPGARDGGDAVSHGVSGNLLMVDREIYSREGPDGTQRQRAARNAYENTNRIERRSRRVAASREASSVQSSLAGRRDAMQIRCLCWGDIINTRMTIMWMWSPQVYRR